MIGIHGSTTMEYEIEFKMRGYYQLGPLVLESGDLFGLHRRYRVGTDPNFVLVYPKVLPLEGYDLASRRPVGEIRLTHRLFEDPTRIAGVRKYEAGDPLNRVHWRATARTGLLHSQDLRSVDDRRRPRSCSISTRRLSQPRRAVSLGIGGHGGRDFGPHAFQMGQQVGLVTNGRDAADRIRVEGWAHDYRTRTAAPRQRRRGRRKRSPATDRRADAARRRAISAHYRNVGPRRANRWPGCRATDRLKRKAACRATPR